MKVLKIKTKFYQFKNILTKFNHIIRLKVNVKFNSQFLINVISSKDPNETSTMHLISDDIEIMIDCETDKIIEKLVESLLPSL